MNEWIVTYDDDGEELVKGQIVRCKDCKYFELNHIEHVDGIPLILAHQICTRWGNGCKTDDEGYCFMGERREVQRNLNTSNTLDALETEATE